MMINMRMLLRIQHQLDTVETLNVNLHKDYIIDNIASTIINTCKQFGHGITHCTLLPKVLAIMQFQRRNSDKCNHVLKRHTMNNTVNSKQTFVRTLMNMESIPQDDASNAYLQMISSLTLLLTMMSTTTMFDLNQNDIMILRRFKVALLMLTIILLGVAVNQ